MKHTIVTVTTGDTGARLDKCLASHMPNLSRSRVQQLIEQNCVASGAATITNPARKVKPGEVYKVSLPAAIKADVIAKAAPLTILYEDKDLLVIDKPAGMTVHPAPGHTDDTLVNALLAHCGDSLSGIGGVMRPGIVHRIDKDTSGLLVVAKHDEAHRHLAKQLEARTLKREYLAVVKGMPKPPASKIEGNIARSPRNRKKMAVVKTGGKNAVTHYKTEKILGACAFLRLRLETGRTHQIRVHLAHIGHPVVGDAVYGRKMKGIDFPRQALHAHMLTLVHPTTGKKMDFSSPLPRDMQELISTLDTPL